MGCWTSGALGNGTHSAKDHMLASELAQHSEQ